MSGDDGLRVGGRTISREVARRYAAVYLTDGRGWAYPSYDGFQPESATGPLVDGDLLAPLLLNVSFLGLRAYEGLQARRTDLQHLLERIPIDLDLLDAGEDDLSLLGDLFAVLDGEGIKGVQGTVLAKVLHRKRPRFIPLYDERVRSVYQDGTNAPVPVVRGRSWQSFIVQFAGAVRNDLRRELPFYSDLAALACEPRITPLRALDIVAWRAGAERPPRD